jgi:diguanylate cyclase (GGDEF)-like protein
VVLQWGYVAAGVSLQLISLAWTSIMAVACAQIFLQGFFLGLYRFVGFKRFALDLVFLVHIILTGTLMIGVAHIAQPHAFELMLFYLPLVIVGYNVTRITSKVVIAVFGSLGFLILLVLYHVPSLHEGNFLAQVVMPLWRWMSYFALMTLTFVLACLCAYLNRTSESKSQQLLEELRMIKRMTVKDDLTGLFNQRYMIEQIEKQKDMADRGDYNFVLAALSIDDLTDLADDHSESAAHEVMQTVASMVNNHVRNVDFCSRWDDSTFVVLLINTTADRTKAVFERISQSIEDRSFYSIGIDHAVTVSIGLTQYMCTESWQTLVQRAQRALSNAQEKGSGNLETVLPTTRRVELVRDREDRLSPL